MDTLNSIHILYIEILKILSQIRFEQCENQSTSSARLTFYKLCACQVGSHETANNVKPISDMFLRSHLKIKM